MTLDFPSKYVYVTLYYRVKSQREESSNSEHHEAPQRLK